MIKNTKSGLLASYPHLWRWVIEFGTLEIGHGGQTRSFIQVLDEGGGVWKGRRSHQTLDAALANAETGAAHWMKDQLGIGVV